MITDSLIDRLHARAAEAMLNKVREGRKRALLAISKCCVIVTDDGRDTRELIFDRLPTVGQLADRVGPDVWVVSVSMRRVSRRERVSDYCTHRAWKTRASPVALPRERFGP